MGGEEGGGEGEEEEEESAELRRMENRAGQMKRGNTSKSFSV